MDHTFCQYFQKLSFKNLISSHICAFSVVHSYETFCGWYILTFKPSLFGDESLGLKIISQFIVGEFQSVNFWLAECSNSFFNLGRDIYCSTV